MYFCCCMIFFHVILKPTKIVKTKKMLVHARSRTRIQHYPLQGKQLILTKTKNMHNFKRRYKIECAQRVSGITITRYDYSQNMWKPDNLQSLRAIVFKVLAVLPKNRNRSSFITTIPTNWARELDDSIVGLGIESFQGHCIFT